MTTKMMMSYMRAAGSRGSLRLHVPSAAQIRRGAYPGAVALALPRPAGRRRALILLTLLCGLGAAGLVRFDSHPGVHSAAVHAGAVAPR